jgi:hypothetical protein
MKYCKLATKTKTQKKLKSKIQLKVKPRVTNITVRNGDQDKTSVTKPTTKKRKVQKVLPISKRIYTEIINLRLPQNLLITDSF